jgi:hypothetical protein
MKLDKFNSFLNELRKDNKIDYAKMEQLIACAEEALQNGGKITLNINNNGDVNISIIYFESETK